MRREDLIAFTSAFSLFTLIVIAMASFSSTRLSTPSSTEKSRFSVNISQCIQYKKAAPKPRKVLTKKKAKVSKKSVKKKFLAQKSPVSAKKIEKIIEKIEKPIVKEAKIQPKEVAKVDEKIMRITPEQKASEQIFKQEQKKKQLKFFKIVKEEINRHKHYPRVAKRRNIEGSNQVSFTIFKNGSVKIHTIDGKKIFFKKSREALIGSFPVLIPKDLQQSFPLTIKLSLVYRLA